MYSLYAYSTMIADQVRMQAYARALEAAIEPGMRVVDLGAGSGIHTLLACHYGASHVDAIEPSNGILAAKALAKANHVEDRITWHQRDAKEVTLSEAADVLVCDLRGRLPLLGDNFEVIADARERFLRPGGALIPQRDDLWLAVVSWEKGYQEATAPWGNGGDFGFDLSPLTRHHVHRLAEPPRGEKPIWCSEPARWTTIDYATIGAPGLNGEVELLLTETTEAHGLLIWFDTELMPGIGFSGQPGPEAPSVYGCSFLPWPEKRSTKVGDRLRIRIEAKLVAGEHLWSWDTLPVDTATGRSHPVRQSSFFSEPIAVSAMKRRAHDHIPTLGPKGAQILETLTLMDGNATVEAIATALHGDHPGQFATLDAAIAFVGELSQQYSR